MLDKWQSELDAELAKFAHADLLRAATEITDAYRGERSGKGPFLRGPVHRAAYLAVRAPATLAAASSALHRLQECAPELRPRSLLDLGAGPGTATVAALDIYPDILDVTLLERDPDLIAISRRILPQAHVIAADLADTPLPKADLILCSFALNELSAKQRSTLVHNAMLAADQALLFIEPGSREGFSHILAARQMLIDSQQFKIAAPCPGHMECPLANIGDWCHFSARVQRSKLHRQLKGGSLPYEDEKFSYVSAVRHSCTPAHARTVRRPEKSSGFVKLELCTPDGLQHATVTKRAGDDYRRARKSEWGDAW